MKHHVFRGSLANATCSDCKTERQWVDEAKVHVYRVRGGEWLTVKPRCIREIPRDVASGVRA